MSVRTLMLKQGKPRLWLGALRHTIQRTQAYYSLFNIVFLLITTYTVREATIRHYIPEFNFWWLLVIGMAFIITVAILDYKFIHPSEIAFTQSQAWKHKSPIREKLEELEKSMGQPQEISDFATLTNSINELNTSIKSLEELLRDRQV